MQQKQTMRLAMKERLTKLGENDRRVQSQVIVRELRKLIGDPPKTIAVYLPYTDEPDIKPLIADLMANKFSLCLPKADTHRMTMHRFYSMMEIHKNVITGIPEPLPTEPIMNEKLIDIVLVPGRAFTSSCLRLGRGSGGYDHWIAEQRKRNPATQYFGLCFDNQIVQDVPLAEHDQRMDAVVTSTHVYRAEK